MAYVDLDDKLLSNGDIAFTSSKRHKAYNLITYTFPDMPEIFINIANMVQTGVDPDAIDQAIIRYLSDFRADPHLYEVTFKSSNGVLQFSLEYRQGEPA